MKRLVSRRLASSLYDIAIMETQFKLKLIERKMITPSVLQLTFTRSDELPLLFIPGQFITFLLPHVSGKIIRRSYSLSNRSEQCYHLEIAVAPVDGGYATKLLFNLKTGDELFCTGPKGRLLLPESEVCSHYILVATSTGIAPYRSMLSVIAKRIENDENLNVTLLLGVRYAKDLLYTDDFIAFSKQYTRFNFRAYLSRENAFSKNYEYPGRYVQSAFYELNLNPITDVVYLCGNPHMINESIKILQKRGFSLKRIRYEKYISVPVSV